MHYPCPYCEYQVPSLAVACPSCERDLQHFAVLNDRPNHLFNAALEAGRRGDWVTASMNCNAALLEKNTDPGLWMLLGTIYANMQAFKAAEHCFQVVTMFNAQFEPARRSLENIRKIRASSASAATEDASAAK